MVDFIQSNRLSLVFSALHTRNHNDELGHKYAQSWSGLSCQDIKRLPPLEGLHILPQEDARIAGSAR
jgi:hypothetical protein